MSIYHGIRITVEDKNLPIQEFYDDLEVAKARQKDLIEHYEGVRQNNINWLMQFQGLTQEQASQAVEKTIVEIEQVGDSENQVFPRKYDNQEIKITNLDKKSKLYYNIYIKKIKKQKVLELDKLTKIKK